MADSGALTGLSPVGGGYQLPGAPILVLPAGDWAYDPRAEVWRPLSLIEAGTEQEDLTADQLGDLLDAGAPVPEWFTPPAVARELRRARPPRSERGFVLFLTGLSGSGKSTIARDLRDVLSERGDRRVSLLDGDLVRQAAVGRADVLPRGPRPQHRPDRLRGGRGGPARRHRDLRADRAVRRGAGHGSGRWSARSATSC